MEITEKELKRLICESIEENCTDEGFFGNMWSGLKNAGNQAGQTVNNKVSNQWNKAKNAGYRAGQAISQGVNSMKSAYNAGAAQNAQRDVEAQIEKSQQIINREQEKINQLRNKMNGYINKANKYANKANVNSINRGGGIKYQGSNIDNDDRTQDFYNNQQMANAKKGAMLSGAKNARRKMRQDQQTPIALQESDLRNIIREAIKEIKAQTIQNAVNNRYKSIEDKENNNDFYRENGFGAVDRERTNDQIRNIENNYNDMYCTPFNAEKNKMNGSNFNVSFGKDANKNYSVHSPALSRNASAEDRLNLSKNPKFKQWKRENNL